MNKNNKCIDCEKQIWSCSVRCNSCAKRKLYENPKKNPSFIDGRTTKDYYCIECTKKLKNYNAIRCQSCENKRRHKIGILNSKRENNPRFGKPIPHVKGYYYRNIWMRSSWEVKYAQYLDHNKISWLYEPKAFDLVDATYRPDFYLPKTNKYVEIKGFWFRDRLNKFKKFRQLYPNVRIKVLMEKNLKKLGIL